jgi:TPR repeat protein
MCLLGGLGVNRNLPLAIQHFNSSAENSDSYGLAVAGWMAEHGIGTPMNVEKAANNYELSSVDSSASGVSYGRCCQTGRGIPVDFTVAAEFFRKAADSDDPDDVNSFGCCLERGEGLETDIERAVRYYRKAASQNHPDGLYNI